MGQEAAMEYILATHGAEPAPRSHPIRPGDVAVACEYHPDGVSCFAALSPTFLTRPLSYHFGELVRYHMCFMTCSYCFRSDAPGPSIFTPTFWHEGAVGVS